MRRFAETTIKQGLITLNPKKALLVLGAPKVGKSWLIQKVLSTFGVPCFTIDLLANPRVRAAISFIDDSKDIVAYLVDHCPVPLIKLPFDISPDLSVYETVSGSDAEKISRKLMEDNKETYRELAQVDDKAH